MKIVTIEEALELRKNGIFIDVRSEAEFLSGHIPNAINIPLLDNNERRVIGTLYKQVSRKTAIKKGLDFFGPKMKTIIEEIEQLVEQRNKSITSIIVVYCWRGGMRSNIVAWLLDLYGFDVALIEGGYKNYRNWCLKIFNKKIEYKLIGGYTGTGKTTIIHQLVKKLRIPVIDLESIANHRGSAFGAIGMGSQPSQEMFENILALQISDCLKFNNYVVLEDESQRIGTCSIPQTMWENMKSSSLIFLDLGFEERLNNIINDYGKLDRSFLASAIIRLQKKLGGLETKTCLEFLVNKDIRNCFSILLKYYDKSYKKSLELKKPLIKSFNLLKINSESDSILAIYEALNKQ